MNAVKNLSRIFSQDQYDTMQQHGIANLSEESYGLVACKQHIAELILPIENQCHSLEAF